MTYPFYVQYNIGIGFDSSKGYMKEIAIIYEKNLVKEPSSLVSDKIE